MFDSFKKFKDDLKYLNPEKVFNGSMEIKEINENTDDLTEALGITPERYEVLATAVKDAFKEETKKESMSTLEIGKKISKLCKHPNESFIAFQMICEIHIRLVQREQAKDFMDMMKRLKKGGDLPDLGDLGL